MIAKLTTMALAVAVGAAFVNATLDSSTPSSVPGSHAPEGRTAQGAAPQARAGEWPYYAADAAATHYSPLDQITTRERLAPEAGLGVETRRGRRTRSTARGPARSRTRR